MCSGFLAWESAGVDLTSTAAVFALATWRGEKQRKALAATGEQTIPKERNTGGHTERPTTKYGPDLLNEQHCTMSRAARIMSASVRLQGIR